MKLKDMVQDYVIRNGTVGKARLALASGISVPTIEKVRAGHIPKPQTVYKLAKACGCSGAEALVIAGRHSTKSKDRTSRERI